MPCSSSTPTFPGLIEGDVATFVVIDPAGEFAPFSVGNHVLDPDEAFKVKVEWKITGLLRPLWLSALGGRWNVQAYAESIGGGPEVLLASDNSVAADPNVSDYAVEFTVQPSVLTEGNPGSNISGLYKLVVSVFLKSNLGSSGFDMTGFLEGPFIQVEDPA